MTERPEFDILAKYGLEQDPVNHEPEQDHQAGAPKAYKGGTHKEYDKLIIGSEILDQVHAFLDRFIAYPSEAAHIAHTLWIAHSHFMDRWESTPRIAFLSPEPGSGKSRALEVTDPLVPRPIHAVNATSAYLFRKVSDEKGLPTILYDEIDTLFGPRAKENEEIRGMINAGHRRGAVAGRCVKRGKNGNVFTEELPAYCAVALAGLNDLPDTIMTRSLIIRMKRRAPHEYVEPWRVRINTPQAWPIKDRLSKWADESANLLAWPDHMPYEIQDRNADIWEALIMVADLAGGEWAERARLAAVALVTASQEDQRSSLGMQLIADLKKIFDKHSVMSTEAILEKLNSLDESPWGDLHGKALDARSLARRLSRYGVKSQTVRLDHKTTIKGYRREDLADLWSRYVAAEETAYESVTSVTESQDERAERDGVTDVTDAKGTCSVLTWRVCPNRNCQHFGACVLEGKDHV